MKSIMHTKSMYGNENSPHKIKYGLSYIRGNKLPYFSVTVTAPDHFNVVTGAAHDVVLKYHPDMQDIVSLHLSDVYGSPTYDLQNSWYWYSSYDGKGTHVDDSRDIEIFAEHVRISLESAKALNISKKRDTEGNIPVEFVAFIDAQRDRWRGEADAVIEKYNLYGWDK